MYRNTPVYITTSQYCTTVIKNGIIRIAWQSFGGSRKQWWWCLACYLNFRCSDCEEENMDSLSIFPRIISIINETGPFSKDTFQLFFMKAQEIRCFLWWCKSSYFIPYFISFGKLFRSNLQFSNSCFSHQTRVKASPCFTSVDLTNNYFRKSLQLCYTEDKPQYVGASLSFTSRKVTGSGHISQRCNRD